MLSEANVNISVVLMTGGEEPAGKSVELFSSNGTRLCSLPDLPGERWRHSQTGLITCGGGGHGSSEQTSCVTFDAGSWKKTHTLGQGEWPDHTAWASPQGVMLMRSRPRICFRVLGNACRRGSFVSTKTELLTDNGNGDSTPSLYLDYSGR